MGASGYAFLANPTYITEQFRNFSAVGNPECPQKSPYAVEPEPGIYCWCACGRSRSQPFCDGSHQGTDFAPVKLEMCEAGKVWLCGCKHSADQPMCDGSHSSL